VSPAGHSAKSISGQVLLNGQPSKSFKVLLWRNGKNDNEVSVSKGLTNLSLEANGFFTVSPETKNFTLILVPSGDLLQKPLILYDFENEKLLNKIVLSETPQLDYNIRFENQNNAISQFAIPNYINVNTQMLLKGTTFVLDPTGVNVPISGTAEFPKAWAQEAAAVNEKILILQRYALRNSEALSKEEYLVKLAQSLSLLSFPSELLYVAAAQVNPKEDVKELETAFVQLSYAILMNNRAFVNRVMSLIAIASSQIDLDLKKAVETKKQQRIVWEKPNFTTIALTKDLLSLPLSATSRLEIELGSYTEDVCGVIGNKISLRSKGTCSLYALQSGDSEFLPASPFRIDFLVQAPTVKKTTTTCIKGKLIIKVTAVKPKCPRGYKVKK
jgi:hypothetical protein